MSRSGSTALDPPLHPRSYATSPLGAKAKRGRGRQRTGQALRQAWQGTVLWEGLPPPPRTCIPLAWPGVGGHISPISPYISPIYLPYISLLHLAWPGVGGMRGFTQVRCLHVHTAHALVEGGEANIVGRWVLEALRNGEP